MTANDIGNGAIEETLEAELARRIAARVPEEAAKAEAELCRRLAPRLRLYGRKHLRDDHAAADLAQQVLLMTLEKLRAGRMREPQRVVSFVFGACRMMTMEMRRGQSRREQLLQQFRADGNAVLLGTASFWEGVDVKGDALRLVVIEKLPFASPEDPLVRARIEHLTSSGANAFRDYQLPEAALALKQGAGRLIRSEEDHGVVVICDPRMLGRGYGRTFIAALPPMSVTQDADEALRFLSRHAPPQSALTRAATTP